MLNYIQYFLVQSITQIRNINLSDVFYLYRSIFCSLGNFAWPLFGWGEGHAIKADPYYICNISTTV